MTSKTVLITGCSSGFGRAMVTKFLENGWTVFATMRRADERRGIFEKELQEYGERLSILELDVTCVADRFAVAEALKGGLDCLINNAGYMLLGALEDCSEEEIRSQFEVNFFAAALFTQELLPKLRERKGTVINISSVFGFLTWPLSSVYCASKYALEGLTESLRQELKPFGVKVSLIEPGSHRTGLVENLRWGSKQKNDNSLYRVETQQYKNLRSKMKDEKTFATNDVVNLALRIAQQKFPPLRVQAGKGIGLMYRLTRWFPQWIGNSFMNWLARRAFRKASIELHKG